MKRWFFALYVWPPVKSLALAVLFLAGAVILGALMLLLALPPLIFRGIIGPEKVMTRARGYLWP